jgi:hypothetical protein
MNQALKYQALLPKDDARVKMTFVSYPSDFNPKL